MGRISHIYLAPERKAGMHAVSDVTAVADGGLEGDRYAKATNRKDPGQQVTLIELEQIERFFVHRGGRNARIVTGGSVAVGSAVVTAEGE